MKRVLSPNKDWGPAVEKYRIGRYAPRDNDGHLVEKEADDIKGSSAVYNLAYEQDKI